MSKERTEAGGGSRRIVVAGDTCWRIAPAERATVLVDAAAYFSALHQVAQQARHSILIAGWDFERRETMLRDDQPAGGLPVVMGEFLEALLRRRRSLQVHLLLWDFAMIYSLDRESFPIYNLGWRTHRRLHLHMDAQHPLGACHHQKIVVVDDAIAFAGGIDLTRRRWDLPGHDPGDVRRIDIDGKPYAPFHDVQLMVQGEVASALGDLVRQRWQQAGARRIRTRGRKNTAVTWPETIAVDFEDVQIGVARSAPAWNGTEAVTEILRSHEVAIDSAREYIYIENQYLSARVIVEALAASLQEAQGPEVLIVLPREASGWLEQVTMDLMRRRALADLHAADQHDRLRVYYPALQADAVLRVHSKLMIVDGQFLRVGSANLSNRSMGLDSESDLLIEATNAVQCEQIRAIRDRLLAEHLHVDAAAVSAAEQREGSLIAAVEALRGPAPSLTPLPEEMAAVDEIDTALAGISILDPERPLAPAELVARCVPEEELPAGRKRVMRFVLFAAGLMALVAAWRWSGLSDWLSPERVSKWLLALDHPLAAGGVVALVFGIGAVLLAPVTVLIVLTGMAFGPLAGFFYAWLGVLCSAAVSYGIGLLAGRDLVRKLGGRRVNRISQGLAKRGIVSVVALRFVPVAPYALVNVAAGASHIRFRDYMIGTAIGMAPLTVALTFFATSLADAAADPDPLRLAMLGLAILVLLGVVLLLQRWLRARKR